MRDLVVWLVVGLGAANPALGQDQQASIRIGVLAKRGAERCSAKWGPTAEHLTEQIPEHTFVIVPLNHDEIHSAVQSGAVDFVLANPSFYVELEIRYGASRIATLKNLCSNGVYTTYGAVIFHRAGRDNITSLADLKGKTFMAVEETSFGGWRMAWRELNAQGIDPHRDLADVRFGGTHDGVVYAVRDGHVDAGTVRTDALERMEIEGKIDLRDFSVIHEHGGGTAHSPFSHSTRSYPEWPFAKVRGTADALAQQVAIALLGMPVDSPAAKAARCAGWAVPHNYQAVHECLKELRVGPYEDYGKITLGDMLRRYWLWLAPVGVFLATMAATTVWVLHLYRVHKRLRAELESELSERQRAEEALRASEERFNLAVLGSADGLWDWPGSGDGSAWWSARYYELLGYEEGEIEPNFIGLQQLLHPDDKDATFEAIRAHLDERVPYDVEYRLRTKPGEYRWFRSRGQALWDKDGKPTRMSGSLQDIDARKRAEMELAQHRDRLEELVKERTQELETAQAELLRKERLATLGRLTATVSHELRNPLGTIRTSLFSIAECVTDRALGIDDVLDRAERNIARCDTIIEELLDYARTKKPELSPTPIDEWLARVLEEQTIDPGITLVPALASDTEVLIDREKLRRCVVNLVTNACQAMQEREDDGAQLTVETRTTRDRLEVRVIDTGPGILPDQMEKIFEPLYSTKRFGVGLGLPIVKQIMELHGGGIKLESEPGKGTKATLWLPLPGSQSVPHEQTAHSCRG